MVSQAGIAFALVAGGTWGVVLFASKRYFPGFHSATFMALAFGAAALWYAPFAVFETATTTGALPSSVTALGVVLAAIALLTLGLYLVFHAISIGEVSHVAPISKVTPVFVVPLEVAVLGEHLAPLTVAGVVVATVAVYLANYEGAALTVPIRRAVTARPARLALASAMVLALLNVTQRYVLQELGVASTAWIGIKLAGAALLLAPVGWRHTDPAAVREALPRFVVLGAVLAFGEHFIGLAFVTLPASVATPTVGIQSIVAVLLGGVLLEEEHFAVRLVAAVVAVVGIAMIAAA